MAIIQMSMMSKTLARTVPVNVILPVDKMRFPGMPEREDKPYKTLYLLHGVFGSCVDWLSGTRIQRWAEEKDLVVVMPSGDNAFYVDQPASNNYYGQFIGQELVELTRKMFPLSAKREDTYIAGLSMGGYGALRNGLKYSENFGAIAALSSALVYKRAVNFTDDAPIFIESKSYAESCFGPLDQLLSSDKNPEILISQLLTDKKEIPAIYMACGTDDSLLDTNQDFHQYLDSRQIPHTYIEAPGSHEWDFWDRQIKAVLDWLPLENSQVGINSGNVGI